MPAPQASMMKQLARLKFSGAGIKIPMEWKSNNGASPSEHYTNAFKQGELATAPDTTAPPLFMPQTMNRYHTDTQKKLNQQFGTYLDGICTAICGAWGNWQSAAKFLGATIPVAPMCVGGQVVGPPLTPDIQGNGPMGTPQEQKYTQIIATVIGTAWLSYTGTIKAANPLFPTLVVAPGPVSPPMPSVPMPVASFISVPVSIAPALMKQQMMGQLGDPRALHADALFDAVTDAFDKVFKLWQTTTMIANMQGMGPVPSCVPPPMLPGPVVGGMVTVPGMFQ